MPLRILSGQKPLQMSGLGGAPVFGETFGQLLLDRMDLCCQIKQTPIRKLWEKEKLPI